MAKWRQAVGVACLAVAPGAVPVAAAFGLGHAVVLSTLGQPLSANIAITQITPDEAQSLRVGIASGSLYQARNLGYSAALDGATLSLRQDANGRAYLHLSGSRPVQEPFVDLLLRADWAGGEITRNYTLLLDPPGFHEPGSAAVAPQLSAPPVRRAVQHALPAATAPAAAQGAYTVQRGDTLYSIARAHAPGAISLDQMLAALYRSNTSAFIAGDINRLRAGAVLELPSAQQARQLGETEAHRIVIEHSGEFGAYRRRLAQMSPQAGSDEQRSMHGKVQAQVAAPEAASQPQPQLKLSQAGVALPGSTTQQKLQAAQKQAEELAAKLAAARADVAALARLAASASAAAHAMPPGAAPAASVVAAATAPATLHASSPAAQASAAAAASRPHAASAPAAASAAHPVRARPKPAVQAAAQHAGSDSGGALGWLKANPLIAPGGLLIGVLLAGWAVLRGRRRGGDAQASVFDSHMSSTDSFFGASGGERVDTHNSTLGSSFQYQPSQVDGADVDPVAEADVYLAYGRDLQAEEILKEALKLRPERSAARLKLLEIYAKRKDARSFELMAAELFTRSGGGGEDWKKAQELGRELDPVNPLYHSTQAPLTAAPSTAPGSDFAPTDAAAPEAAPTMPPTELLAGLPNLSVTPTPAPPAADSGLDLELQLGAVAEPAAAAAQPQAAAPAPAADMSLDFDLSSFSQAAPAASAAAQPAASAASEPAPLEFDLGELSLQPPAAEASHEPVTLTPPAEPADHAEPADQGLDTRLALVEECRAMGDLETARHLLHEILAESDGPTRAQAEKLLAQLG